MVFLFPFLSGNGQLHFGLAAGNIWMTGVWCIGVWRGRYTLDLWPIFLAPNPAKDKHPVLQTVTYSHLGHIQLT